MSEKTLDAHLEHDTPRHSALAMQLGFGQRKKFLVNRRHQLRSTLLVTLAVLVPLVFLNIVVYNLQKSSSASLLEVAPEMTEEVRSEDSTRLLMTGVVSVLLLGSVILISIFETHKTAGAAFRVGRDLARIADGLYGTRLRLRSHDNLKELEPVINELGARLEERERNEIELLERLATRLEKEDEDASSVSDELRQMAADKQSLLRA